MDHLNSMVHSIAELEMSAAIIECLAIRCPDGEYLKLTLIVLDIGHLVLIHIIGNQVAYSIEHLYAVGVSRMEALTGLVGGIDSLRMLILRR